MAADGRAKETTRAVLQCQQDFWHALQHKDTQLLLKLLADDFVCRSPGEPDQTRAAFIQAITAMPIEVLGVAAEQVAVHCFDTVAVLTGTQVAQLQLPDGGVIHERLALTNIFRQTFDQWQMVLAHPVTLSNQASD